MTSNSLFPMTMEVADIQKHVDLLKEADEYDRVQLSSLPDTPCAEGTYETFLKASLPQEKDFERVAFPQHTLPHSLALFLTAAEIKKVEADLDNLYALLAQFDVCSTNPWAIFRYLDDFEAQSRLRDNIAEKRKEHAKLVYRLEKTLGLVQDTSTYDGLMPHPPVWTRAYSKATDYRRKALRCVVAGSQFLARPDSASDRDIITEAFAEEHGISVEYGENHRSVFRLGTGKLIKSVGRALVPLSVFGDGQSTEHRWFDVLAKCPVPVILGLDFIRKFKLFTQNKHLLVDCPYSFGGLPTLKWIGSPRERMNFIADGDHLVAGADTGSDLDLMSLRCARKHGFKIDNSESARTRVMLADETIVETVGKVYISSIQLSNFDPFEMSFDVLPGLPCDVIFGEEFLDQMDAFNTCDIVHLDGNVIQSLNTLINLGPIQGFLTLRRASKPKRTPQQEHDELIEAEIYRRNKANRALARIKDETRAATASALEERMRRDFDARHTNCLHCIGAVTARNDLPMGSSSLGSTVRSPDQVVQDLPEP